MALRAEAVESNGQIRLLKIVDIPQRLLHLFEEAAVSLAHLTACFADDEMMDRLLKNKLIAPPLSGDVDFLNDAELFEHFQISVDARPVDAGKPILEMGDDLWKGEIMGIMIDKVLQ